MQKSTDQLHYFTWPSPPSSQISMANPRISFFSKKIIRTNTENSAAVELFIKVIADQLFYSYTFCLK